jgi:hypothetical protein
LAASIAALSQEEKLAAFGDMLHASKKVQALEEAGQRVESLKNFDYFYVQSMNAARAGGQWRAGSSSRRSYAQGCRRDDQEGPGGQ